MSEENKSTSQVLGWRKFVSFCLVVFFTSSLTWFGKIQSEHYADVIFWAMAIFFASNVSQHLSSVFSKRVNVSLTDK